MATFTHPGIDMVENLRTRGDRDDFQIKSRLLAEKAALNLAMERTSQVDPAKLNPKDIQQLRGYEVALAYIDVLDLDNKATTNRLRCAINGTNPSDQPNDSTRYAARREYALAPKPGERVTSEISYT